MMSRKKYPYAELFIGTKLRAYRKELGLTVVAFANLLKISQGSLSDLENGRSFPAGETIMTLLRCTDIDIDWLIGLRDEIHNKDTKVGFVAEPAAPYATSEEVDLVRMTREVLNSGTDYARSLKANIRSFHKAIQTEERLSRVETRLADLEAKIDPQGPPGGAPESKKSVAM